MADNLDKPAKLKVTKSVLGARLDIVISLLADGAEHIELKEYANSPPQEGTQANDPTPWNLTDEQVSKYRLDALTLNFKRMFGRVPENTRERDIALSILVYRRQLVKATQMNDPRTASNIQTKIAELQGLLDAEKKGVNDQAGLGLTLEQIRKIQQAERANHKAWRPPGYTPGLTLVDPTTGKSVDAQGRPVYDETGSAAG